MERSKEMEFRDHEQQDAEHVAVPASLLPSVLRRLGLEDTPTTRIDEQIAVLRNEERRPHEAASLELCAAALHDPAWEVRAAAVWALRAYGEQAPVEALLNALTDEDSSVRAAVLRTLSGMSGHVSREPALRLLHDADWKVREAAALTLEEIGEQPQLYKEMETHLVAQTDFNGYPDQAEQQKTSPAFDGTIPPSSIDMRDTSFRERQRTRSTPHRSRLLNLFNELAAVLVVGLIIVGALLLFAHRSPNVGSAPAVPADVPFQPLPRGCFFIPQQHSPQFCPHDPFTKLNLSKDIDGYTITLKEAYADANQVLVEYTATRDADHQSVAGDLDTTLRTHQGITLRGDGGIGFGPLFTMSFDFEPATMPATSTRTLSLHLIINNILGFAPPSFARNPVTIDFSLPFHPGRVVIMHKTVTVAGKSVTLERMVATPSETRFYLNANDTQLYNDSFSLTDNGRNVNVIDISIGGITNRDGSTNITQPLTSEVLNFDPLFASHAECVLMISAPAGIHAGPWFFHFTV
jgi:HEAT repeats